jgi:hypothetical protein
MKTIKNSDIRFEINSRIIYVPSFEMKFYTVNPKEFFFKKTDEDVEAVEESGETKYYIDLDWQLLKYVGKGVLNYQCTNNIADPSFPDGEYNQLIEKTTDYFIDTFTVEPEGDESIAELLEKEEEERKEADAVISGAVDTEIERAQSAETALQEAIDAEESARTAADETLNNAITAETSARTAADEALSGAVDTKLQDYYLKSETSGKTEIQTALDGKSDKGHTHDERYYRKDETSGATELEGAFNRKLDASAYTPTDLSNYYTKDETSGKSEIASAISDEATARANADTALSGAVDTALLGYVNNAAYVSTAKTINLLHGETVIASVDATDFIKDGMVDNVVISGGSLVITFNTDSGKEAITIALTDIFDPANYYTKTDVDGIVSGKADTTAVTQAITEATSGKANSSDVYLKTETSGKTEIATALSAKLDVTAYTPTDLSNYYTKGETSGKTEIQTALGTKQDTLVAGDNITISGNVISAAGGDLSDYYTKAEVDEMSEVAAQGINDLNTNKLDVTAYTPTDLSQYWTSAQTQSAISQSVSGKQDTLVSGTNIKTVNNESLLGSGNITIQGGGGNDVVELTQAEYDALTTKDPDTFYVITDATAIDLSQYWTSAQTQSAITQSVSGKQDTLSAGTGIDITSNVISVTGGTGGKAIEAGRGISITTGETADTVSFNLPISSGSGSNSIIGNGISGGWANQASSQGATAFGLGNTASGYASFAIGGSNYSIGDYSFAGGTSSMANETHSFAFGYAAKANGKYSIALGSYSPIAENTDEVAIGKANISRTGSTDADKTLFTVGNGTNSSNRHNAFEIRQNGDIYITSGGTDIKLQDNLGGGGSSINVVQTTGTSTGDVMSQDAVTTALSGKQDSLSNASTLSGISSSDITSWDGAATNASTAITNLGGLKLQQITQSAYDALTTKDASTLYVIVS